MARLAFDVPAIVNIPLFELEQRWSELPKDRELVLVCESGVRSLKATNYLQFQGFTRVSNLEGGTAQVDAQGLRGHRPALRGTCRCHFFVL